jgi:hypothetical protein
MSAEFWPSAYVRKGYVFSASAATVTITRSSIDGWADVSVESISGSWRKRMPLGIPWTWTRISPPLSPSDLREDAL